MFSMLDIERRLDDLQERLRRAPGVTPDLMLKVVAGACYPASPRLAVRSRPRGSIV